MKLPDILLARKYRIWLCLYGSKLTQVKLGFNVWSPAGWHLAFADRAAAAEMPKQEEVE